MVTLDSALFFVGIVAEVTVFGLLLFRHLYKSFPVFTSYLAWSVINDVGLFTLLRHFSDPHIALRIYLASAIVDAIFVFWVFIEIFMSVLSPIRSSMPQWAGLRVAALVLCLCGLVWFLATPSATDIPVRQLVVHWELTTAIVRVLYFVALAALSHFLSLGWRDREFQIVTGFGIYSFASLVVELVHQNPALWFSPSMAEFHVLEQIAAASYVLTMFYWSFSFAQAVHERREFTPQMHNFLLTLAGQAQSARVSLSNSYDPKRDRSDRP